MKTQRIFGTLFFFSTITVPHALAEINGEVSLSYGNDYIGARNGYTTEIFYDGDIVPLEVLVNWNNLKLEFRAVSIGDNIGSKPVSTFGSADYTFYKFSTGNMDWSLSTGISAETHDASDNYQVSISGIEGTLVSLGFNLKGDLDWLPNTYFQAGGGYTESLSDSTESSPYAVVGFGLTIPVGKFQTYLTTDLVYTDVLSGEHIKVELGVDYSLRKNLTITGPGKIYIVPGDGKTTNATKIVGVKYLF